MFSASQHASRLSQEITDEVRMIREPSLLIRFEADSAAAGHRWLMRIAPDDALRKTRSFDGCGRCGSVILESADRRFAAAGAASGMQGGVKHQEKEDHALCVVLSNAKDLFTRRDPLLSLPSGEGQPCFALFSHLSKV